MGKLETDRKYEKTAKARARQKRFRNTPEYREHDKYRQLGYRRRNKIKETRL